MKVILTEKVPFLGNVGEIINVSSGHGRNYLIPQKLAVLADDSNRNQLANNQKRLEKKIDAERKIAEDNKKKIDGVSFEFIKRVGGTGKLFGTVTNAEIAKEIAARGVEIERRLVVLEDPIKSLGTYTAAVKLFSDVEAKVEIKVVMDPKQAEEMKAKQIANEKRAIARKEKEAQEALAKAEQAEDGEEVANEDQTEGEIKEFEQDSN